MRLRQRPPRPKKPQRPSRSKKPPGSQRPPTRIPPPPPPRPTFPSIFSPSKEKPKPISHFTRPTWAMYGTYLDYWHERNNKFNSFAASYKYYYKITLKSNKDGRYDHMLGSLAKAVSDGRNVLMVDLEKLEERFEAWCNGSSDGDLPDFGD